MINVPLRPETGDLIRYDFYEDDPGDCGLVLEILNPIDFWSQGLGLYPEYVLRVLDSTGQVKVWDFFRPLGCESELEILNRRI